MQIYSKWRHWLAPIAVVFGIAALLAIPSGTNAQDADEYSVKAEFLSRFPGFVTWPEAALGPKGAPFVIGVFGRDPIGRKLEDALKGKSGPGGRPFAVIRRRNSAALAGCPMVFVGGSEKAGAAGAIRALGRNTLVVGDWDGMARSGGSIGMGNAGGTISLTFNPGAASRAGLRLSSKLLRLGKTVR